MLPITIYLGWLQITIEVAQVLGLILVIICYRILSGNIEYILTNIERFTLPREVEFTASLFEIFMFSSYDQSVSINDYLICGLRGQDSHEI